ncbi:transcriptional regulator, TetR family [Beutenbergia cavernae DSM 12333]|uniref:Transcriptional regulator, TetR family n=2 Tax=Beutenbergia TaxID=84756 RepID=C5BVV9_BEUC1|nr:transcriptional regulator, TetR family [Beutenbergia cavernae DSM 12333]
MDPRVVRTRFAIVAAGTDLFLERGYVGTSLDEVAARAGVAKRSVYNNYADKEELFRAVVLTATGTTSAFVAEIVSALEEPDDLEEAMRDLARRQLRAATSTRLVRLRRLLIGEVSRFPDLAREYAERVPGRVVAALAAAFEQLTAAGRLRVEDPERAAEHFAFLVLGSSLDRALLGDARELDDAEVAAIADSGVTAFLAAYGTG